MPGIRGTTGKVPVMLFWGCIYREAPLSEGLFVRSVERAPSPAALDFDFRESARKDQIDQ